ncbi:MAG TPA: sulfur carrier protein ThiS [Dehalococcoidia bacterium]|nr:sulfur carrier protein ThiS [Dehalococcoidia bacterium]
MTAQTISLTLNGKPRNLPGETPLLDLLAELGVDRRLIAVAHNGDVVPRDTYERVVLRDGDSIEVVRMVGGG